MLQCSRVCLIPPTPLPKKKKETTTKKGEACVCWKDTLTSKFRCRCSLLCLATQRAAPAPGFPGFRLFDGEERKIEENAEQKMRNGYSGPPVTFGEDGEEIYIFIYLYQRIIFNRAHLEWNPPPHPSVPSHTSRQGIPLLTFDSFNVWKDEVKKRDRQQRRRRRRRKRQIGRQPAPLNLVVWRSQSPNRTWQFKRTPTKKNIKLGAHTPAWNTRAPLPHAQSRPPGSLLY